MRKHCGNTNSSLSVCFHCCLKFMSRLACVAGGIVRVRGKILTVESEYGRRSCEENGKETL